MAQPAELPSSLRQSPSFQIERVRRHTKDQVEQTLGKHGSRMRAFWILSCVLERPLIDSLEQNQWVKRDRDPEDRRRQIVTPTKKGSKAHPRLVKDVAAAEDRALDMSTTKQLKSLKKLSKAILDEEG